MKKPKRRAPPLRLQREIRVIQVGLCGCRLNCGAVLPPEGSGLVHFQHDPPLGVRPINEDGTDWIPPQHDPAHLFAELKACHDRETYGDGTQRSKMGADRFAIDKMKRREKPKKHKRKVAKHMNPWPPRGSQKIRSKGRFR